MKHKHGIILSALTRKPQLSPSSFATAGRTCPEVKETHIFLLKYFLLHKCAKVLLFKTRRHKLGTRNIKNKLNIAQQPEIISEIAETKCKQIYITQFLISAVISAFAVNFYLIEYCLFNFLITKYFDFSIRFQVY